MPRSRAPEWTAHGLACTVEPRLRFAVDSHPGRHVKLNRICASYCQQTGDFQNWVRGDCKSTYT